MDQELDARDIAILAHGDQKYGDEPYVKHLDDVADILESYGFDSEDMMDAAYLHDAVEDTDMTIANVHSGFGPEVAQLVNAVTGEGLNRRERQANILQKIRAYPAAAPLKLADRIANVRSGEKKRMYQDELPAFAEVIEKLVPPEMWLELIINLCGEAEDDG